MPARRLTAEQRALREFIGAVVAFSGDPGPDNLERYLEASRVLDELRRARPETVAKATSGTPG